MTAKEDAKRFWNNLKRQAQENPIPALFAAAAVITATTKLIEANTQRGYQKAHAKEIDRRVAMQYNKGR